MGSHSAISLPTVAVMLALLSMLFAGMPARAQSTTSTAIGPAASLPAYMHISCGYTPGSTDYYPQNDSLIRTTAAMMDWCGCENKVNPMGLAYAGMSVYDDVRLDPSRPDLSEQPARAYICSANANASCDSEADWYQALGNVSAQCGQNTIEGYFYDSLRQMAWGFGNYWDNHYCSEVGWIGISS